MEDGLGEDAKAFILACKDGEEVSVERNAATDELLQQFFLAHGFTVSSDEKFLYASKPNQDSPTELEPISLEACTVIEYVQSGQIVSSPPPPKASDELEPAVAEIEPAFVSSDENCLCATREPIQCSAAEPLRPDSPESNTEPFVLRARPLSYGIRKTRTLYSRIPEDTKLPRVVSYNSKADTDETPKIMGILWQGAVAITELVKRCLIAAVETVLRCFSVPQEPQFSDIDKPLLLEIHRESEHDEGTGTVANIENHVQRSGALDTIGDVLRRVARVTTFGSSRRCGAGADERWIDFMRISGNAPREIEDFGNNLTRKLPRKQVPFCSFCFVSSYKRDLGGGFLARIVIDKLQCGVLNSFQESTKRGFFVENFIISMEPQGSSCAAILRFTPEPDNIKWQVQNREMRSVNVGLPTSGVPIGLKESIETNAVYDYQLWSWKPVFNSQKPSVCQFSWHMEWWKTPRLKYNVEKPERCGFPIPELPYNGDSFFLPSGITSVEWHVPPGKVSSKRRLSWSFNLKAKLRYVEITGRKIFHDFGLPIITHSHSDECEVIIPFKDVLELELP